MSTEVKIIERLVKVPAAPVAPPPARPRLKNISEHLVEVKTPHGPDGSGFYAGLQAGASVEIPESVEAELRAAAKDNPTALAVEEVPGAPVEAPKSKKGS